MTNLGDYLKEAMSTPFEWGEHDCCTFCANWMGMHIGADLLEGWRGEYETESEAMRLLHERGGIEAVFERQIAGRADRVARPVKGSVGIMNAGDSLVGAIYSGERWVVFSERGVRAIPHRDSLMIAMWGLPNG